MDADSTSEVNSQAGWEVDLDRAASFFAAEVLPHTDFDGALALREMFRRGAEWARTWVMWSPQQRDLQIELIFGALKKWMEWCEEESGPFRIENPSPGLKYPAPSGRQNADWCLGYQKGLKLAVANLRLGLAEINKVGGIGEEAR